MLPQTVSTCPRTAAMLQAMEQGEWMPGQTRPQTKDDIVDMRNFSEVAKDSMLRHKRKRARPGALGVDDPTQGEGQGQGEAMEVEGEERATKERAQGHGKRPVGMGMGRKPWKTNAARPTRAARQVKATRTFEERKQERAERRARREAAEQARRAERERKRQEQEHRREKARLKDKRALAQSDATVVDPKRVKRMSKKERKHVAWVPSYRTGGPNDE